MKTIEVFADTRGAAQCRSCNDAIEWAEIVKSGKRMPFNAPIVALRTRHQDGRLVEEVDLTTSHFATCPDAKKWGRR